MTHLLTEQIKGRESPPRYALIASHLERNLNFKIFHDQ